MCFPCCRLPILIHISYSQLFSKCSTDPVAKPISQDGFGVSGLRAEYMPPESISISTEPPTKGFRSKGMFLLGNNLICGEADDMAIMVEAQKAGIMLDECWFDLGR